MSEIEFAYSSDTFSSGDGGGASGVGGSTAAVHSTVGCFIQSLKQCIISGGERSRKGKGK